MKIIFVPALFLSIVLPFVSCASIADRLIELENTRVAITNAIAMKGVTPSGALTNVPNEIASIPSGGESLVTTNGVNANEALGIRSYAFSFSSATSLPIAITSSVEEVGPYAFRYARNITSISLPNLKKLGTYAFYNSRWDGVLNTDNLESVDQWALYGTYSTISGIGNLKTIAGRNFSYATILNGTNTLLTSLPGYSFGDAYIKGDAYFPNVTSCGNYSCNGWTYVSFVKFGKMTSFGTSSLSSLGSNMPIVDGVKAVVDVDNDASGFMSISGFPWSTPTTTKFRCADAIIKYVDGAWTIITE